MKYEKGLRTFKRHARLQEIKEDFVWNIVEDLERKMLFMREDLGELRQAVSACIPSALDEEESTDD